jgi:hypothetical protein
MAFTIPVCASTIAASLYVLGASLNFQWKFFTFSNGILTHHSPCYILQLIMLCCVVRSKEMQWDSEESYPLARL